MMGYITCRDEKERSFQFGGPAKKALEQYLGSARAALMHGREDDILFVNCSGGPMSRQGFWKILKPMRNPQALRRILRRIPCAHSFATHLLQNGCGFKERPRDDGTCRYFDDTDVSPSWRQQNP